MITMVPVFPISASKFFPLQSEWDFLLKPLDKLACANYNIDKKLAVTNHTGKEQCFMMIHPLIQFGGAMIGGLVTLGLFAYNIASLFYRNQSCSGGGCSIR